MTTWKLSNLLLNDSGVNDEIKGEIKKFFETSENKIKKLERYQIDTLVPQLKELENQEQTNSKASRRQEITKIRVEFKEVDTKNPSKVNIQQSVF